MQFCLFLFLCITNNAMEPHHNQRAIVRSILDQNNEKLSNWDIITATTITRKLIEPLPNIFIHGPTLWANLIGFSVEEGIYDRALNSYKKVAPRIPDNLSLWQ